MPSATFLSPKLIGGAQSAQFQKSVQPFDFTPTGSFQGIYGEIGGFSQPTMSHVLHTVTDALCDVAPRHIRMPVGREVQEVMQGFYEIAGFPTVLGSVDDTHIRHNSLQRKARDITPTGKAGTA